MNINLSSFQALYPRGKQVHFPYPSDFTYSRSRQLGERERTLSQKFLDIACLILKIIFLVVCFLPICIYTLVRIGVMTFLFDDLSFVRSICCLIKSFLGFSSKTPIILSDLQIRSEDNIKLCKRILIEVEGKKIDAMLVGTRKTLTNGRWIVFSEGSCCGGFRDRLSKEFSNELQSENGLPWLGETDFGILDFTDRIEANLLVYDYPFYQDSTGFVSSFGSLSQVHRTILDFVEDPIDGLGAIEVVSCGYSFGGCVQLKSLVEHQKIKKNPNVKYVVISLRVPTSLVCVFFDFYYRTIRSNLDRCLRKVLDFVSWTAGKSLGIDFNVMKDCKNLTLPHIVYGTCIIPETEAIDPYPQCYSDSSIPGALSLRYRLFVQKGAPGISESRYFVPSDDRSHQTLISEKDIITVLVNNIFGDS